MEWLTDKEKRILLSALTREKEVCIRVDKELCREPYEETLESVCKSLENKFYYDRLFKQMERQIRADAIQEFAEWLPKHFDLRFSNNPQVWVDEYFNHTSEKVMEQLRSENEDI